MKNFINRSKGVIWTLSKLILLYFICWYFTKAYSYDVAEYNLGTFFLTFSLYFSYQIGISEGKKRQAKIDLEDHQQFISNVLNHKNK